MPTAERKIIQGEGPHQPASDTLHKAAHNADWSALAARSQAGDKAAYAMLLQSLAPVLSAYFRRSFSAAHAAEDLMQETLLAIHNKFHTYRSGQPFAPWAFAIARYKGIDHVRYSQRQISSIPLPEDETQLGLAIAQTPEVEGQLAEADFARVLETLSPRDREIIRLSKIEVLDLAEVATRTNLTLGTLKVALHRALARLRTAMLKDGE